MHNYKKQKPTEKKNLNLIARDKGTFEMWRGCQLEVQWHNASVIQTKL